MRITKPDTLRYGHLGSEPGREQAAPDRHPAGNRRRAGPGPCHAPSGVPGMRRGLRGQGLPPARDRHTVRPGCRPAASFPLRRMRRDRDRRGVAIACPLGPGDRPTAGAALGVDDYRTSAEVLAQMFPVMPAWIPRPCSATPPRSPQSCWCRRKPGRATRAEAIVVTLDSTFIRSSEAGEQHLEVRIGNAETSTGRACKGLGEGRQAANPVSSWGVGARERTAPVPKLVWRLTLVAAGRGGDGDRRCPDRAWRGNRAGQARAQP